MIISSIYFFLLLFDFLAQYAQIRIMQRVGQQTMYDMRCGIFAHLQRLPMKYFDHNPVGRLVTRVTTDVDALNDLFAAGVVTMINDLFLLVVMAVVLFWIDWKLAFATLAVLPGILVVTYVFRHYVREANRKIRTAIARINAFLQEYISGMHVVQLFNREPKAIAEFERRNRDNMLAWRDAILAYALFYPAVEFLSFATIALIFWAGGMRILGGTLTLGVLTAFTMYAQRFFRPIQDLSEKFNILQSAMAASERIFKLMDEPVTIESCPDAKHLTAARGEIEFRNVWFSYRDVVEPADEDWVLRDVSFRISPGQTFAIVGHTGAGKTTLISLLLRFYDIQRGQILLDGVDIRFLDLQDLRRHFGIVLQDPFLFTGTIESNIRLGTPGITREDVERAIDKIGLGDFVRTLSEGIATPTNERGSTLSVGQRQLINFARALAHNPRFLILDEATSSVDTKTELLIREALDKLLTGPTALKSRANCEMFGMGGEHMRAAGVEVITDYSEVSVLGITEIIWHLPQLIHAMRGLVDAARKRRPTLAIVTDFPGFHLRLARKLKPLGVQNVYYICPQFWAWRPWRVNLVRRRFALALCIFRFEEKFFGDSGVPVKFIG